MFCKCGALIFLPVLVSESISCRRCGVVFDGPVDFEVSISKEFHQMEVHANVEVKGARINHPCPQCNHPEMMYNTAQLRSADEGQTVFYLCESCGYKETVQS